MQKLAAHALFAALACTGNGLQVPPGGPCRTEDNCEDGLLCIADTCRDYVYSGARGLELLDERDILQRDRTRMQRHKTRLESSLEQAASEAERADLREQLHGTELWLETNAKRLERLDARR